jgi:hypothetical protein
LYSKVINIITNLEKQSYRRVFTLGLEAGEKFAFEKDA